MPRTTASSKKPQPKSRKLKPSKGRFFGLVGRTKLPVVLPSAWTIFKASLGHLSRHKKLFIGISAVYLGLTILLVRGFGITTDLGLAKQAFEELLNGAGNGITSSMAIFSYLVGTNSPNSQVAAVYQSIIITLVSLALIWALRQTHANEKVSLKDVFYKSTYPLVPLLLVILFISIQLLPLIFGSFLYSATVGAGIATSVLEKVLWCVSSFLLGVWTIYLVSSSVFAVYIVTLPDMTPLKALRSAKKLVQFRRWRIIRKIVFLPVIIMLLVTAVMLPTILFLTPVSEVVFLILLSSLLPVTHSYMYSLYRELL